MHEHVNEQLRNFNCERTAELLTQAEQTEQAEQEEANDRLGMTPLLKAVTLGHLSEVKDLLTAVVDANSRYGLDELSLLDTATHFLGAPGSREIPHGARGKRERCQPRRLHGVAARCEVRPAADLLADIIDMLLSAGAHIDAPIGEGFTPLYLACLLYTSDAADE